MKRRKVMADRVIRTRGLTQGRGSFSLVLGSYSGIIVAADDDAYEDLVSNIVYLSDDILRLGQHQGDWTNPNAQLLTGLRFRAVSLINQEGIATARLRFTANNGNGLPFIARIRLEAADNSNEIAAVNSNLSSRARTSAFVDWDIPAWSPGLDGPETTSPDLSPLVEELVGRPGWVEENAAMILIETSPLNTNTEAPRRRAVAFSTSGSNAARFDVNTGVVEPPPPPPPPPPPSSGEFSDGFDRFGLAGDSGFNPGAPTLKNGSIMPTAMRNLYNDFMTNFLSDSADSYLRITTVGGTQDLYANARRGQLGQESALCAFRLTGDLRILDRMITGYTLLDGNMRTGWSGHKVSLLDGRNPQWASAGQVRGGRTMQGNPWSPVHRSLMWYFSSNDYRWETDIHVVDGIKHRSQMAEFAWALHLNRGKVSPAHGAGYYDTLADYWAKQVEDYWRGWCGEVGTDWGDFNYRQVEAPSMGNFSGGRPAPGVWPFAHTNEGHAIFNAMTLNSDMGRLALHGRKSGNTPLIIQNPVDGNGVSESEKGAAKVAEVLTNAWIACVNSYGRPALITRGSYGTGGGRYMESLRSTYGGYLNLAITNLYLRNTHPNVFSLSNLRLLSRAQSDGMNSDGSAKPYTHGLIDYCGHGLTTTGTNTTQSTAVVARSGTGAGLAIFADQGEPEGAHLINAVAAAANAAGSSRWWPTRSMQFVREAFLAIGELS